MKTDLFFLCLYIFGTLFFAFKNFRNENNIRNYFICNREYSLSSLVATFFATAIGAASILLVSERAYELGFKFYLVLSGSFIGQLFIAIFVVSKMKKCLGALTPGEIITILYSKRLRASCGLCAAAVSIGFVAMQIYALGNVLSIFYNIPKIYSIIIGGLFTILYTAIGGINSVIRTDIWQFCWILIVVIFVTILAVNSVDGAQNIINYVKENKSSEWSLSDTMLWINFALVGFNPSFLQRVFIAKDIKQATIASIIYNLLVMIFFLFVVVCGLVAHIKFPNIAANESFPVLVDSIAPSSAKMILVVGVLAAIMSTADSDLNIAAVSIYKDVLGYELRSSGIKKIRIIATTLGMTAIIMAIKFHSVQDILFFVINFWAITFMFPIIFGVIGLNLTDKSVMLAISISASITILWYLHGYNQIPSAVVGALSNIIILLSSYFYLKIKRRVLNNVTNIK